MRTPVAPGQYLSAATVAVLAAFGLSWHFFAGMNPYQSLMPDSEATSSAPLLLQNVVLHGRHNGLQSWQIGAATLTISPDRQDVDATGLSNCVFYRNNRPALHFTADDFHYSVEPYVRDTSLTISGHASAWTDRTIQEFSLPVRISTTRVLWDPQSACVVCPDQVQFVLKGLGLGTADGLTIDQHRKFVRFGRLFATTSLDAIETQTATGVPNGLSPPPAANSASATDTVTFGGEQGAYYDENTNIMTLTGKVAFHQGAADVDMVGATYDRKTDTATSNSPVSIDDQDVQITGDHGSVDFATHLAILQGHVIMLVIPKPGDQIKKDQQEVKKPTSILCDQVNYDYKAKRAHTTGPVTIKQTNRTVTADDGQYDVSSKIVELNGNVVGKSTDGRELRAPKADISVNENDEWIRLFGPISGEMSIDSQDNPLESSPSKTSKAQLAKPQNVSPTAPADAASHPADSD